MVSEQRHIGDLKPDAKNARRHNPRNIGMIVNSLHEVGPGRSIVIDEDNNILAGNGTWEAAAQAGIEKVQIIERDPEAITAVRVRGLSKKAKKRLALFDNRTAELADWEPSVLQDEKDILEGLFSPVELNNLLNIAPANPDELWQGMPDFEQSDLEVWKTLQVHFANEEDYEAFSRLVSQTLTPKTKYIWYPYQERLVPGDYVAHDES
jgi:hypothetical protein